VLYVARVSIMNWNQMRGRCPSPRFVGIAILPDRQLGFTRKSNKRGYGVADVVATNGSQLRDVVYELVDLDVGKCDASAGVMPGREKNLYYRRDCVVFLHGEEQRPLTVSACFADRQDNPPLPNAEYKSHVLAGARHWQQPGGYIRQLGQIEVSG